MMIQTPADIHSTLWDGSTHAKSENKNIQCILKEDTAHSQVRLLNALSMHNMTTSTHNGMFSRQIQLAHDESGRIQ